MSQTKKQHTPYTYDEVKEIAEQYETLAEFTKKHVGAYEAALHHGWLDSFTHLKRKRVHSVESVLEACRKFNSYKEFIHDDKSIAYAFNKLYNDNKITDNDLPWKVIKRKRRLTYEDCYNEAKKYKSRYTFKLGNESSYNAARRNHWLSDYVWFEKRQSQYTYEICKELASHYKSRADFQRNDSGAYSQADRQGWLNDFHFEEQKIKWNKEMILEECKKYKTKTDLFENNKHAYDAYRRYIVKGLITDDEIGWEKRSKAQGDENARINYVYVYDFGDNFAYVGRTIDPHKRDRQHRRPHHSHGMNRIGGVLQHSIDTGIDIPEMTILESELNLQESCCQEDFWLQEYRKRGYTMLNKGVTGEFVGSIGGFKAKWTKDVVIEFAKQYPNYADLLRANQSMKYLLKKFNLLDELYPNRLRSHKFTFEEVKEVASKYPTRTRFKKGSQRYYYVASKNKWLDALYPKSDDE